jgi:hypothetical protein
MKLNKQEVEWIIAGLNFVKAQIHDDPEAFGIRYNWNWSDQAYEDVVLEKQNEIGALQQVFLDILHKEK